LFIELFEPHRCTIRVGSIISEGWDLNGKGDLLLDDSLLLRSIINTVHFTTPK
jgi:hypothetical protein